MTREQAAAFLLSGESFILLTHESADADGLGAEYALAKALTALGKRAIVANNEPVSPRFAFIDQANILSEVGEAPLPFADYVAIVVDTIDVDYCGKAGKAVLPGARERLFIDHHDAASPSPSDAYIECETSSTCEMVYELLRSLGVRPALDDLRAIYSGMVYDSGSFVYPKTSARTLEIASEIATCGVVPNEIFRLMYESGTLGALMLRKRVLQSLEVISGGRIALQSLTRKDLKESGARYEDGEELINAPLQCEDVVVSVMFKENSDGSLRCSLRSKGQVDVAKIAQAMGGGGHKTASGFRCRYDLAESRRRVIQTITEALGTE